jgi:S-adenosylmethionine:tRNA ribosyltransferase-isomerase
MRTSDFDYILPPELIAQHPAQRREMSRLMVMSRSGGKTRHMHFYELPELIRPGDCLVFNDSRVIPARLFGHREATGGAVEVVLLWDLGGDVWECLTKPGRKTRPGTRLVFGGGELRAEVIDSAQGGNKLLKFEFEGVFLEVLERLGNMPLPPYIHEKLEDPERYQTVYSREPGSAAAPTAGLHFTEQLLEKLRDNGVMTAFLTLHIGLGTFRPVKEKNIEDHVMHSEYCVINDGAAEIINSAREAGGRIIAVGTTSCRTLEAFAEEDGHISACSGWTDIFIYPGYRFKTVDGLITNFHLPQSTLIMLVSALAGRENVLSAYNEAVRERYRFFSFGDAMFIEP